MNRYQIAVVVGSLRKDSLNRKLADELVKLAPPEFFFKQIQISDLPLYNQDDDTNEADSVKRLKADLREAHAILFLTPEYNRSIPGVLKNALDHASHPYCQNSWAGKPAGVLGASVGVIGSALAQKHLRNVLAYLDVPVLGHPKSVILVTDELFDETGNISANSKQFFQNWMDRYIAWVRNIVN